MLNLLKLSFTQFRVVNKIIKHTDHYSVLLKLKIPSKKSSSVETEKKKVWNTNRENGWSKYKEVTDNNEILRYIASKQIINPTQEYRKIENERDRSKYKAFGKTSFRPDRYDLKTTEKLIGKKETILKTNNLGEEQKSKEISKVDEQIANSVRAFQKNKLDKEFEKLKRTLNKKGKSSAIFKLKDNIFGSKIQSQDPTAIQCQ